MTFADSVALLMLLIFCWLLGALSGIAFLAVCDLRTGLRKKAKAEDSHGQCNSRNER